MLGSYWLPIGNHTLGIQWSHDRWRHVTRKVKVVTPIHLKLNISFSHAVIPSITLALHSLDQFNIFLADHTYDQAYGTVVSSDVSRRRRLLRCVLWLNDTLYTYILDTTCLIYVKIIHVIPNGYSWSRDQLIIIWNIMVKASNCFNNYNVFSSFCCCCRSSTITIFSCLRWRSTVADGRRLSTEFMWTRGTSWNWAGTSTADFRCS